MNARTVVLPMVALGVALVAWWQSTPAEQGATPAATWRVGPADAFEQARNYHELPADSPVRLSFVTRTPRHVYVFSQSAEDGTILMFPSPEVDGSPPNPLPTGRTVLPGSRDDGALSWTTRAEIRATTCYVAVASEAPVPELEALLPRLRRWSNKALTDRSMQVTNPRGEVELAGRPREAWPAPVLARAASRAAAAVDVNGPMHPDEQLPGVWSAAFRVRERPE